jgi:hydroxymethylbilane synthase
MQDIIRIGTRGSRLALVQAEEVKAKLAKANSLDEGQIEIVPIKTTGDMILDRNLSEIGGKGLFTKEIEEALISGNIDLAVHSMKDMPAFLPDQLEISAILTREDPRDAFISHHYPAIKDLPQGALVGSSSSRRKSQLLNMRPDLNIINFRGNIDTRINKLKTNVADATLLAVAGLKRLNFAQDQYHIIDIEEMLPAVAQGAIGIESRKDSKIRSLIDNINHYPSQICIICERAFLEGLGASCATPIAALAVTQGENISLQALIASRQGVVIERTSRRATHSDAYNIGMDAARELLARVGGNFFD